MASRPPFSFQQAQYAQVFPLKIAPSCTLFAGLGNTNKSAISLLFFSYLTLALSLPPCTLLHLFFCFNLCQKLFSLFSSSIRLQWVPGHSFLLDDDAADELARRGALLVPSAIPCSHSSLLSGIHSCLFSDWRHTVSSKFFDTQVSSISTEELVLLRHARCDLSRLRCNGHSLLLSSYLSRIGRIENSSFLQRLRTPLISLCTVQLRTLCIAHLWQFSVSLRPLFQALGSSRLLEAVEFSRFCFRFHIPGSNICYQNFTAFLSCYWLFCFPLTKISLLFRCLQQRKERL